MSPVRDQYMFYTHKLLNLKNSLSLHNLSLFDGNAKARFLSLTG